MSEVLVRCSRPSDARHAAPAAALIAEAARDSDIAVREESLLREKIVAGRAALALESGRLVGFGYFSDWDGGAFVSHSGLVVREDHQGTGLGRRLKEVLFQASRRLFPDATTMSLTSSKAIERLNLSLGFRRAPLSALTRDPEFWKGCLTCRNYERVDAAGEQCCCFGMIRPPEETGP